MRLSFSVIEKSNGISLSVLSKVKIGCFEYRIKINKVDCKDCLP